jgi:general secretion pathway protein A
VYERFYGFREKPFSILPDPSFLYLSRKHSTALDLLEYGMMNQAGFNVITGEIGTGKTTLVRYVLNHLERDITVGLISNTHRSFGELLQWILFAFKLEHRGKEKVEMFQNFLDFLIEQYAQNRRTLLIVDEAQNISADTLEELRMLSNINADKDQVLQVVLVGQAGLRERLRQPELEQFAQRIAVDYHLEPLNLQETHAYIHHRIKVVGGEGMRIFDAGACNAVYEHSRGIPRLINLLCDTALVYGFAEQKPRIDARIVDEVARDKKKGGIFPSQKRGSGAMIDTRAPVSDSSTAGGVGRAPNNHAQHLVEDRISNLDEERYAGDMDSSYRAIDTDTTLD